jgi:hypothetical protein
MLRGRSLTGECGASAPDDAASGPLIGSTFAAHLSGPLGFVAFPICAGKIARKRIRAACMAFHDLCAGARGLCANAGFN